MSNNRDEFPPKIKRAVAARAGWRCSFTGCPKLTVGPSEEALDAITNIGKAAHISGAAPGPGSRRYDHRMTPEERAGIGNAIWLCADHADLIDRDEVTYSVETLRTMKREHEAVCALAVRSGSNADWGTGLLAVGPDIVCTGDIAQIAVTSWTLRLKHFVVGNIHEVISFIDRFAKVAPEDRYVLSNELGDGRVLSHAPSLTKQDGVYSLLCPIMASVPRIDAQNLGSDWALHPERHDLYADEKGNIALVSGLEGLYQRVQCLLSMQQGENPFFPAAGTRFFEYFEAFRGSPWFPLFITLDIIRLASIPIEDTIHNRRYTPLQCVTRVRGIELLSETPNRNRLPMHVDFDVEGVGQWQREISVYIPTQEQVAEREKLSGKWISFQQMVKWNS
jgi:hypothetical protein